jgi:hypothetical protein
MLKTDYNRKDSDRAAQVPERDWPRPQPFLAACRRGFFQLQGGP